MPETVVLTSLSQNNEAKLKKDGAAANFEKSKLHLDTNSQALIEVLKEALNHA
jgi:hypothetical protein